LGQSIFKIFLFGRKLKMDASSVPRIRTVGG
jgi:hypothetical protein